MRFMIIRRADDETESGAMPGEELLAAMARYNEEMVNAGVMRSGDGLHPSSKGARVSFSGGRPTVIDGPFAEAKELIAGFSIIEVGSREEAIEWVKRWPAMDAGGNVQLEIRQLFELEDFAAGDGLEHHARLREQMERR